MTLYDKPSPQDLLAHHGIKGQKWGVRRYQNSDGSYTPEGKKRYGSKTDLESSPTVESSTESSKSHLKRNVAIGAAIAGTLLAAYGAYRYTEFIKDKNVELAAESTKKTIELLKRSDAVTAEKYPWMAKANPEEHYAKMLKENMDKARAQKFSEAYQNVKKATAAAKEKAARREKVAKIGRDAIKELRSGKPKSMFSDPIGDLTLLKKTNPDIYAELGVSMSGGHVYVNGKQIY